MICHANRPRFLVFLFFFFFFFAARTLAINVLSLLIIKNRCHITIIHRLILRKVERSSMFLCKGTDSTAFLRDSYIFTHREAKGEMVVFKATLFSSKFHRRIGLAAAEGVKFGNDKTQYFL